MYSSSRNRAPILILLLVLSLVALVLYQAGQLHFVQDLALGVLEPVLGTIVGARDGANDLGDSFTDARSLRARVAELQAQLDVMSQDSVRLRELEIENATLRQQLGYKQASTDYDLVGAVVLQRNTDVAHVIASDPSSLVRSITIDQGSAEGIKPGMPVITPQGLVGRITTVGTHWSKVLLILDPSSSVNSVVLSTRATGIVQGDVTGNLIIRYVPQGEAIKAGDLILTSGMGANFPKRLIIGKVTQVRKRDIDLFQEATIQPSVDFMRLEFVLVLKTFTPSDITSEPTPTPTAAPSATRTRAP